MNLTETLLFSQKLTQIETDSNVEQNTIKFLEYNIWENLVEQGSDIGFLYAALKAWLRKKRT